jgi:hypothetical protein
MEGGARSGKSAVIKVAKAEGDGAAIRDSRGTESVGEGAAERMEKDSRTHAHHIIQQTYEVRVAIKGNAPCFRFRGIHHGRQDLLRGHVAFEDGFACVGDEAGVGTCGYATAITQAISKISDAVGAGSGKLSSNIGFKVGGFGEIAEVTHSTGAASQCPAAKHGPHMGARDVDLIPVRAKHVGTGFGVACEQNIPSSISVTIGGAPTHTAISGVRAEGLEGNDTVRVHGAVEGREVTAARGAKVRDGEEGKEAGDTAMRCDSEDTTWAEEPCVEGISVGEGGSTPFLIWQSVCSAQLSSKRSRPAI